MSEVLKSIAEDIKTLRPQIEEAKELIAALKEAGENTTKAEQDLRSLEIRLSKWERMLKARNLMV